MLDVEQVKAQYKHSTTQGNTMSSDLEYYTAYTLVDITDSGITKPNNIDSIKYNQAQNLNVLFQIISLRTQPLLTTVTKLSNQNMSEYKFGSQFTKKQSVWKLTFATEHKDVWIEADNETYHLAHDCDSVAITTGLEETAKFSIDAFCTIDNKHTNIYFSKTAVL